MIIILLISIVNSSILARVIQQVRQYATYAKYNFAGIMAENLRYKPQKL